MRFRLAAVLGAANGKRSSLASHSCKEASFRAGAAKMEQIPISASWPRRRNIAAPSAPTLQGRRLHPRTAGKLSVKERAGLSHPRTRHRVSFCLGPSAVTHPRWHSKRWPSAPGQWPPAPVWVLIETVRATVNAQTSSIRRGPLMTQAPTEYPNASKAAASRRSSLARVCANPASSHRASKASVVRETKAQHP